MFRTLLLNLAHLFVSVITLGFLIIVAELVNGREPPKVPYIHPHLTRSTGHNLDALSDEGISLALCTIRSRTPRRNSSRSTNNAMPGYGRVRIWWKEL